MKLKRLNKKLVLRLLAGIVGCLGLLTIVLAWLVLRPLSTSRTEVYIQLKPGDEAETVCRQLQAEAKPKQMAGLRLLQYVSANVRPGRYVVTPTTTALDLWRAVRNGRQVPLRLTLPPVWDMKQMAGRLGEKLAVDSAQWEKCFVDTAFCRQYGVEPETLPCLFMPETYEVYYTLTPEQLLGKLREHYDRFWEKRRAQADAMGLSPEEICTLASIVDKETANRAEKPKVAGMYLNRLRRGMKLQADPTVKFGLGDYALRRILHEHLLSESPYNTYQTEGLPPGPIGMPTPEGIDAVLADMKHNYLYMCANADFSGTHSFAADYAEHLRNAARYAKALDERGVK